LPFGAVRKYQNASVGLPFCVVRACIWTLIGGSITNTWIGSGQSGIGRILVVGGGLSRTDITSAGAIDNITVKAIVVHYDDGVPDLSGGDIESSTITAGEAGIGRISFTGGDLCDASIVSAGPIGSIVGSAVVLHYQDEAPGVLGGNIIRTTIKAGDQAIGRIALRGGCLGSETDHIEIDCGLLGAVSVRGIRYLYDTTEIPMLDRHGCARTSYTGNRLVRISPEYGMAGGEAWMNLKSAGKVDSIRVAGGALGGKIEAAGGIGEIRLRSVALVKPGHYMGIPCVASDYQITVADLLADIVVGSGNGRQSIGSISLHGGSIVGDVNAAGTIGRIRATGYGIIDTNYNEPELNGATILSKNFNSTGIKVLHLVMPHAKAAPVDEYPYSGGLVTICVGG